jgi:predicted SnoaL-like aldol condensation-catalyzing enzyme
MRTVLLFAILSLFVVGAVAAQKLPSKQARNKAVVVAFYNLVLNEKRAEEAVQKYVGPTYTQHNPKATDGPEGIVAYVKVIKEQFPLSHSEIKRVFAEGDFVILHVHTKRTPDALGIAIAEFFRLDHGKIVEHWDVIQPVPETAANSNTMF